MLSSAAAKTAVLQAYVMADTTYNSLGVDEVAAQHASAQCVVSLRMQQHCMHATLSRHAHGFGDTGRQSGTSWEHTAQIHYGRASLSPLSTLPAYFVFTQAPLDSCRAAQHVVEWATGQGRAAAEGKKALLVLLDLPLVWAVAQLRASLAEASAQVRLADMQISVV